MVDVPDTQLIKSNHDRLSLGRKRSTKELNGANVLGSRNKLRDVNRHDKQKYKLGTIDDQLRRLLNFRGDVHRSYATG